MAAAVKAAINEMDVLNCTTDASGNLNISIHGGLFGAPDGLTIPIDGVVQIAPTDTQAQIDHKIVLIAQAVATRNNLVLAANAVFIMFVFRAGN